MSFPPPHSAGGAPPPSAAHVAAEEEAAKLEFARQQHLLAASSYPPHAHPAVGHYGNPLYGGGDPAAAAAYRMDAATTMARLYGEHAPPPFYGAPPPTTTSSSSSYPPSLLGPSSHYLSHAYAPPSYPGYPPPHAPPSSQMAADPTNVLQGAPSTPFATAPNTTPAPVVLSSSSSPPVSSQQVTKKAPPPPVPPQVAPPQGLTKYHRCRLQDHAFVDPENDQVVSYAGCLPLGLQDDKDWMSELHCYLRAHWAEVFAATEDDILAPMHGRNKPILVGQVGIRCTFCKGEPPETRGQQAVTYPTTTSTIYNSVAQMLRVHKDCCVHMPADVRKHIDTLRTSTTSRGGKKQYWIDSAVRLGMQDTPFGIRFSRDPRGPLPPLSGLSQKVAESKKQQKQEKLAAQERAKEKKEKQREAKLAAAALNVPARPKQPPSDARSLVFPDDKPLISDFLYLSMEQMAPCDLMLADQIGCYKTREVGFKGLACRHCAGHAGSGRYFPASEASLSQTTTSQTILNHVRNCRGCPIEIRETLEIMKRNKAGRKKSGKPEHGGRKVFFHRLWCRIQDTPFEDGKGDRKDVKPKSSSSKSTASPKKIKRKAARRKSNEESESDDTSVQESETESEGEEEAGDDDEQMLEHDHEIEPDKAWFQGCQSLHKTDDSQWLSELECFVRSDLVQVFSLKKDDDLAGYKGSKDPEVGQVGICCKFCKRVDPADRSSGCLAFPDMLYSIQKDVSDMVHKHFATCPSLPEETGLRVRQLIEKDEITDERDSQQYWVDAARDLGLANVPPGGIGSKKSWGISFRRDPSKPSPADVLDSETLNASSDAWGDSVMVQPTDHGACPDHVLLILKQVRPCRFRKNDRRAGPGSRGRDRPMGFPGLACMHCSGGNSLGRYFPSSAKNLTDNTANSLQAHVSSCPRCPDDIQASLAYLRRRSILQKASLSGSWKKLFFNRVWDRLHSQSTWTAIEEEENDDEREKRGRKSNAAAHAAARGSDSEEEQPATKKRRKGSKKKQQVEEENVDDDEEEEESEDSSEEDSSEEEEEEEEEEGGTGGRETNQMDALIAAAAVWLTEHDQVKDSKKRGTSKKRRR